MYRTIKTFVEKGIIHPITIAGNDINYALCEEECKDNNHTHQHVHLECDSCNLVYCVNVDSLPEINLGNHQIFSLEIQAKGRCESCLTN